MEDIAGKAAVCGGIDMNVSNQTKRILHLLIVLIQFFLNILFYMAIIMGTVQLCKAAYQYSYQIFGNVRMEAAPGRDVPMKIKEKEGTMELAVRLENKGLVENRYTFYLRARLSTGNKRPILPGSYQLNTSMTYGDILEVITKEASGEET